ncbi:MAG TPA: LacI family DNA-binding transcriptional regulator [Devosiaceae bacterium]|nr:LacI family DNA-binding transcriptional regulator [Devosiaceae bacterium]
MARHKTNGPASITSRDIARAAHVSQALVSRAFSGNGRIAPETRAHILEVAGRLGWQPNALARSMVTGDAPLVAIITARLTFDWRAQVLSCLLKAIQDLHLKPLLFYAESDAEIDRLLGETIGWRTRGVIVTAGAVPEHRAMEIVSRGQFLATLNRPANHPEAFAIATDNARGGAMAADLLLDEGRSEFLVLGGPETDWAASLRQRGFAERLAARGKAATVWNKDTMSIPTGWAYAERYLDLASGARPDAVFATSDSIAIGFLDGIRDRLCIPQDLSIVGFDNLPASSWKPYQLTTFEQPIDEMVQLLLAHVDKHHQAEDGQLPAPALVSSGKEGVIYCQPKIILRATTRAMQ